MRAAPYRLLVLTRTASCRKLCLIRAVRAYPGFGPVLPVWRTLSQQETNVLSGRTIKNGRELSVHMEKEQSIRKNCSAHGNWPHLRGQTRPDNDSLWARMRRDSSAIPPTGGYLSDTRSGRCATAYPTPSSALMNRRWHAPGTFARRALYGG